MKQDIFSIFNFKQLDHLPTVAKLKRYTNFKDLKSGDSLRKTAHDKGNAAIPTSEFETFIISLQREFKKSKDSYETTVADAILHVCRILHKHSVQFLTVGGTAVTLHGHFRHSTNSAGQIADKPDVDFWYDPTYKNYFNLRNALEELGQDVTEFREEQAPDPKRSFFKIELQKFNIDLLPPIKAKLRFGAAYDRRETITLNEIDIPFISY